MGYIAISGTPEGKNSCHMVDFSRNHPKMDFYGKISCRDFAYVEGALMLAAVAGRYSLAFPAGTGFPEAEPLVTVRPAAGLPMVVTRR